VGMVGMMGMVVCVSGVHVYGLAKGYE
jgi:hypothetical protein